MVVALPDHWHGLATVMALDAGKHVYVEKPMSHNILDGRAMVAAAARNPKLAVQVGTQQRSGAHFQEARDFIRGGGLGKVGFARAWITHDRDTVPRVPDADPPAGFDYDLWVGPAPFRAYNPSTPTTTGTSPGTSAPAKWATGAPTGLTSCGGILI